MYSLWDEDEGRFDSMTAYQACHLCHNGNKQARLYLTDHLLSQCKRPSIGGKCKRCATTYNPRPQFLTGDPPSFSDNKILEHLLAHLESDTLSSVFENFGGYHRLTISLANAPGSARCDPSGVDFLGPLRHDNIRLVDSFDKIVYRDWSMPRVEASHDSLGLVAAACLAGGYLRLFFSIQKIVDSSERQLNARTLRLGLAHFILARFSTIVNKISSVIDLCPMSGNARLSLAALHVIVNRIKIFSSGREHLAPLYDDPEFSSLLKERINSLEGELRQMFQDDCGIIKDWGATLDSCRKEFKNTARSLDPLTLTISSFDELSGGETYPNVVSTPSESAQSPLPIDLLPEIDLPHMPFAGLEENQAIDEIEDSQSSGRPSESESSSRICNYLEPYDSSIGSLSTYSEDDSLMAEAFMWVAIPSDASIYNQFDNAGDLPTEWEILFNSDQTPCTDYHEQDLGSPIQWDSDPGNADI